MIEHKRVRRAKRLVVPLVAAGTVVCGIVAVTASPAAATVTAGYACAYQTNISLFGGPTQSQGCVNTNGTANSAAPSTNWTGVTHQVVDGDGAMAQFGPAVFLSSPYDINDNLTNTGNLKVISSGTSAVTMQARAAAVGPSPFYTATPNSYPISAPAAGFVTASCTAASPTSRYGSATIQYGYVDTKLDANGYPIPAYTVAVPTNPAPNTRINFTIDNISPEEHGHMIFNEQTFNADGSITVVAAHMYAEGPIAVGDQAIGKVTCGHA